MTPEKTELYNKWKRLVNMSYGELKSFYDSAEGQVAGLTGAEANRLGIHSGRESAKWIMKMKQTPVAQWTDNMWEWAKRQVSFISRMTGNAGKLYDENGKKTRKHLSLLIWGNNPEKKKTMTNKYTKGGESGAMTPQQYLKEFWGVNVFSPEQAEIAKQFEVKSMSTSNDAKADAFIEQLKKDGFAVKKKTYSGFTSIMGAKRKESGSYAEGGAVDYNQWNLLSNEMTDVIFGKPTGTELIINDSLHWGVSDKPYAYVEDLKEAGILYDEGKNPLFGTLKSKRAVNELLQYLDEKDGYLAVSGQEIDEEYAEGGETDHDYSFAEEAGTPDFNETEEVEVDEIPVGAAEPMPEYYEDAVITPTQPEHLSVEDFDKEMALANVERIKEYAEKIDELVSDSDELQAWVIAKVSRVETRMVDIKQALKFLKAHPTYETGGEIVRSMCLHIAKYAVAIHEMVSNGVKLMVWMENNLAISAAYIDDVYHHLDYKLNEEGKTTAKDIVEGGKYAKGGAVDSLEKELHKLQRELNSSRLQTYEEGDNSEEEKARQKERAVKLARFNEIVKLLNEKEKFQHGGSVISVGKIGEVKKKISSSSSIMEFHVHLYDGGKGYVVGVKVKGYPEEFVPKVFPTYEAAVKDAEERGQKYEGGGEITVGTKFLKDGEEEAEVVSIDKGFIRYKLLSEPKFIHSDDERRFKRLVGSGVYSIAGEGNKGMAKGGHIGFEGLQKRVAKEYAGKTVKGKYKREYGNKYSKQEAMEVGAKVAAKVAREKKK